MNRGPYLPPLGRLAFPWRSARCAAVATLAALLLALLAGQLPLRLAPRRPVPPSVEAAALRAEAAMRGAEDFLWRAKQREGAVPPGDLDHRRSGLIGEEWTPLTTTLGSLPAKRTSTDPRWAAVLVRELWGAGLRRGDVVVAGLSGSFPGLNLAVILACRELGLQLGTVTSVTASTYGANQPGFTWPEMEARLVRAGLLPRTSLAVTAGGDADRAADLEPEWQALAQATTRKAAAALGVPALIPQDFAGAVEARLTAYRQFAAGRPLRLYVNAGGTEASLGRSETILRQRSGFLPAVPFDLSPDRGIIARMVEAGVPVLHLLNVRDLALRWGVPLDD